jgi:hypothetical protein
MLMVQQVIQGVVTGSATTQGRFLRPNGFSWYEECFTSDAVVQKVAHCLRERQHSKKGLPKETAKQGVSPSDKLNGQLKPPAKVLSSSTRVSTSSSSLCPDPVPDVFFRSDGSPSEEEQTTFDIEALLEESKQCWHVENDCCQEPLSVSVVIDDCSSRSSNSSSSRRDSTCHDSDDDDTATFNALYHMVFENRLCHTAGS